MRALMRDGGGGGKSEELNTLIRRWWTMARLSDPQAFVAFANAYIVKKKADGGDGGGGGAASSGVRGRNSRGGGSQTKKKTTTTPRKNAKKQHAEEEVTTTTKADDDDLGRLEKLLADKETEIESKDRLIAELTREVGGKDRAIAELTRAKEELARAKEELARANDGKITVDLAEIRATIESAIAVGATTEARKRIKLTVLQRWHPDKVGRAPPPPPMSHMALSKLFSFVQNRCPSRSSCHWRTRSPRLSTGSRSRLMRWGI